MATPSAISSTLKIIQSGQKLRLLSGFLFSTLVGLVAYRRRSLSKSGVAGAMITGTTTFGLGGLSWGMALIFFFVSSSLFSHFRAKEKEQTATDKFSKGSQRDIVQAAANGGVATLLALGYGASRSPLVRQTLQAGYVGTLATATADTWATELGVLSPHAPRLITTGKVATPGTSGGITLLGTGAAIAGSLALSLFFWLLEGCQRSSLLVLGSISGLAGSLFDSLLGATLQVMYYCPNCAQETERHLHSCGTRTVRLRGLSWMNNDMVNFLSTALGAGIAMLLQLPFHHSQKHPTE